MAFKKSNDKLSYKLKENGINEIISEKNNTVIMLREIAWAERDYNLEIRKWFINSDGETAGKGISFNDKETPHVLVNTMTRLGFGNTKTIIDNIKTRNDFEKSLIESIGIQKVTEAKKKEVIIEKEDYFNPKELI